VLALGGTVIGRPYASAARMDEVPSYTTFGRHGLIVVASTGGNLKANAWLGLAESQKHACAGRDAQNGLPGEVKISAARFLCDEEAFADILNTCSRRLKEHRQKISATFWNEESHFRAELRSSRA